jgi:hypothetical protein
MKKRGIGHIEIILAFILFITAVGFGLYFFSTSNTSRIADTTLTYAFREIEKNTSTSVEVFLVSMNRSNIFGSPSEVAFNFSGVPGNTSVQRYNGRILNSSRGGIGGELVYVSSSNWMGEDILYVMFGEEFKEDGVPTNSVHNSTYYRIGSSEIKNLLSEKRFRALNESYYLDYRGLKGQGNFNLPDRADFGFSLVFDDGYSIVAESNIPEGFEIFSETKRWEVLREDGSIMFANLIVRVW